MGVTISTSKLLKWLIIGFAFLVPFLGIIYGSQYISHELSTGYVGFDWFIFRNTVTLEQIALKNPNFIATPWSVPLILPFTSMPYAISWALGLYLTVIVLIISVLSIKNRRYSLIALFLVFCAYPSIRNFADLNLSFLVITGVLLSLWAYQHKKPYALGLGVLLAAAKPQDVYLLLLLLGFFTLRYFPLKKSLQTALIPVSTFIITMILFGQTWLGNIGDRYAGYITLRGISQSFNIQDPFMWILQIGFIIITLLVVSKGAPRITRIGAGALIVASLITAPYIAELSLVTLLAVGLTALATKTPRAGIPIFLLYFMPYLQFLGIEQFSRIPFTGTYYFFANVISWMVLLWFAHQEIQDYKLIDSTTKNEVMNES